MFKANVLRTLFIAHTSLAFNSAFYQDRLILLVAIEAFSTPILDAVLLFGCDHATHLILLLIFQVHSFFALSLHNMKVSTLTDCFLKIDYYFRDFHPSYC